MQRLIITEQPSNWTLRLEGLEILSPSEYIDSKDYKSQRRVRVINLCRSYHYQSEGYYISLLAEARGHRVIPSTSTMMDVKLPNLAREDAEDFDALIQQTLDGITTGDNIEFSIYLGLTAMPELSRIGQLLFSLFQMPVLKVVFVKKEKWQLKSLKPTNLKDSTHHEQRMLETALQSFLEGKKLVRKDYQRKLFDLAILVNPADEHPPSDAKAIQKFLKAAAGIGFNTELITKADFSRITQFDALFIRETTHVNDHTFRFARKAEYEGLVVIDDPTSIVKCTNKVYLSELLGSNGVSCPPSLILRKGDESRLDEMSYPYVIKQPDGAFSQGVKKVTNKEERDHWLQAFFKKTDLLIAQEFMPSDFDWRVGVLDGKVLFVCKYYMARNHWQIMNWRASGIAQEGGHETIRVSDAPKKLIDLAVKASGLIGRGLYGVDIKEVKGKFYVIEVNDNPNIDAGVEDQQRDGDSLYEVIIQHFMNRLSSR